MASNSVKKTCLDFIQAYSLRELVSSVNLYNEDNPSYPILKDDIVGIQRIGEIFVLLYYK